MRILDFGIARIEGSALTQGGALLGSVNYMSPEQMLGRSIDHRSDIFAAGLLAYELITYRQAFKGGLSDGILQRLPFEHPTPTSEICPDLPAWSRRRDRPRAAKGAGRSIPGSRGDEGRDRGNPAPIGVVRRRRHHHDSQGGAPSVLQHE